MKDYSISRKSRKLVYSIIGNGDPLFIIGFSQYTYRLLSTKLKENYQFIIHDYYGLMNTQGIDTIDLSIENLLDDIYAIQADIGIDKMKIIGHSQSGTIGLDYILRFPEKINKALLICAPPIYNDSYVKLQREYINKNLKGERKVKLDQLLNDFNRRKNEIKPNQFFVEYHKAQIPVYYYDYQKEWENYFYDFEINQQFINKFIEKTYSIYKREKEIESVSSLIHVILGKYDYAVPSISWKKYQSKIPISVCEKSAHYPMLEERNFFDDKFNDVMKSR